MGRYHFIGVGGYSMSGIAMVLHQFGYQVTGSDAKESSRTRRVRDFGIPVTIGHAAENLGSARTVVYSTDVPDSNVELCAARERGIRVLHRSDALAEIMAGHAAVAITGTHGKTTTSSLTGHILIEAGLDPMVMVGGEVESFGGSARMGHGEWIVVEADESDGSFLRYHPRHAVITNMEPEHLEHYGSDFANVVKAYKTFASQVGGVLALANAKELDEVAAAAGGRVVRYGIGAGDVRAEQLVELKQGGHRFTVVAEGQAAFEAELRLPGRHNVENALAALIMAQAVGLPMATAATFLRGFRNAHRRFEIHLAGPVTVVDDYGHHPTEIRAVLKAARELRPRRLIVAFQPQRYTRTKSLWSSFVSAFDEADIVVLTEIYSPPGESSIAGVTGERLAADVRKHTGRPVIFAPSLPETVQQVRQLSVPGDLIVTMGAGDIVKVAEQLTKELASQTAAMRD